MKKRNQKGFTLAELLIVVAIIAVLVAIAIPVFTNQLVKSREAADEANIRAAYAQEVTNMLSEKNYSYSTSYKGVKLNYPDKLTWTVESNKLTVNYAATKIDPLSLTGDPIE